MNPKLKDSFNQINQFNNKSISIPEQTSLDSDNCYKDMRNYTSTGIGKYNLSSRTYLNSCNTSPGINVNSQYGVNAAQVDIESEFRGLNYINTKCYDPETDPMTKFNKEKKRNVVNVSKECDKKLITEYTKNNRVCDNISLIQQNRFDYQLYPLEIQCNNYIGANTRLLERDSVRKVPDIKLTNTKFCGNILGSTDKSDCAFF